MTSPDQQGLDSLLRSLTAYQHGQPTVQYGKENLLPNYAHTLQPSDSAALFAAISNEYFSRPEIQATLPVIHHQVTPHQLIHGPGVENNSQSLNIVNTLPDTQHISAKPTTEERNAKSEVDPRTIVEWPVALRYVTKLDAKNDQVGEVVKKMIKVQHDHERQWWTGREALLQKQADRVEGKRKLDEVLRSIGGQATSGTAITDDVAELKRYDMKVHKAQTQMTNAMTAELAALGIPFLATKASLIVEDDRRSQSVLDKDSSEEVPKSCGPGQITRTNLIAMQRRMLSHLEDLYKE